MGSLKSKVTVPRGINIHQEVNSTFPTLPFTSFSIKTCNVTTTMNAAVSIKISLVVYQTAAITTKGKRGFSEILRRRFKALNPVIKLEE